MGLIEIEGMEFYAYHGHYKEERYVGNRFLLDICISTDTTKAENSDNIEDTLNYQKVYAIIKDAMENKKSHLIENIGRRIINRLYENFDNPKSGSGQAIDNIKLKISKINPPMGGQIRSVSVTIEE
ncbi:MAG: dihydroneopterin aldolase [Bacteroidota bacterium]